MILDNQQQKNLLINIIRNTQLQGRYRDLKNDIVLLDNLLQAVQNAEIKNKKKEDKENHPSPNDGEPTIA